MGGYRDDLGAAVARADALQQEVDELKAEVEQLRRGRAGAPRMAAAAAAIRERGNVGAYAALGAMLLFVGLMVMLVAGWSIPEPAPPPTPEVYVQFGAAP